MVINHGEQKNVVSMFIQLCSCVTCDFVGKDQSCTTPKENGRKVVQLVVVSTRIGINSIFSTKSCS